jgi:riboflavin biosynthesis pyrimidine reductase
MSVADLHPTTVDGLTDEELLERYVVPPAARSWVRFNFIVGADGAATLAGRSGGLGNAADRRLLSLLRRPADVILVGAGTVRAEGYGGELLDDVGRAWRTGHSLAPRPVVAVVSGTLDLDPRSPFFTEAPARPLVFTCADADPGRRRELGAVADVLLAGRDRVEPVLLASALTAMRFRVIHSEGGPTLFGAFLRAGLVDDLCLSLSPLLVGGGLRILPVATPEPVRMRLAHVLESEGLLLLRYLLGRRGG